MNLGKVLHFAQSQWYICERLVDVRAKVIRSLNSLM